MIKKTYYVENPAKLSIKDQQLCIDTNTQDGPVTRDIDDAGLILLDHAQISVSVPLLRSCAEKKIALTVCDEKHLPIGIYIPMYGQTESGGRIKAQIEAPKPLKKQIWQKTISAKILNQANVLKDYKKPYKTLLEASSKVRSGDSSNIEGTAAAFYWRHLFDDGSFFRRDRYGVEPNSMLNYVYSILRSQTAKCLVGSGLNPMIGVFHHNVYNTMALADDMMEPFRPFADALVKNLLIQDPSLMDEFILTKTTRKKLLGILNVDVLLDSQKRPLQVALQHVCAKLALCFLENNSEHLIFPVYEPFHQI